MAMVDCGLKDDALSNSREYTNIALFSFASVVLLFFLYCELWSAWKRKRRWIPPRWLLLGSFTLTLLQIIVNGIPNVYSLQDIYSYPVPRITLDLLFQNRMMVINGKLAFVIFLGYIVPGVSGEQGWDLILDMVSIFVNVSIIVIRTIFEAYIAILSYKRLPSFDIAEVASPQGDYSYAEMKEELGHIHKFKTLSEKDLLSLIRKPVEISMEFFVLQSVAVIFCLILLFFCLCIAILASKSIRDMIELRIMSLTESETEQSEADVILWPQVRLKLLKSCLVTMTYNPGYIINRSVLTHAVFLVSNICFIVFFTNLIMLRMFYPKNSLFVPLQGVFIVTGWGVISWRWLLCVSYHPKMTASTKPTGRMERLTTLLANIFHVEDFWLRTLKEFQKNPKFSEEDESTYINLLGRIVRTTKIYKLATFVTVLQAITVCWSKLCWFISQSVFGQGYLRKLVMEHKSYEEFCFLLYRNGHTDVDEEERNIHADPKYSHVRFLNFSDALFFMRGESPVGVWIENVRLLHSLDDKFERARKLGEDVRELRMLVKHCKTNHEQSRSMADKIVKYQPELALNMHDTLCYCNRVTSIKMTIVSLLSIIVELAPFFERYKSYSIYHGMEDGDLVGKYIRACEQGWQILDFAESSTMVSVELGRVGDRVLKDIGWIRRNIHSQSSGISVRHRIETVEDLKEVVESLKNGSEELINTEFGSEKRVNMGGFGSKKWRKLLVKINVNKMYVWLLEELDKAENTPLFGYLKMIEDSFSGVVAMAVEDVMKTIDMEISKLGLDEERVEKACLAMAFAVGATSPS